MSVENQIERINQNISNTYTELEALGADAPDVKNSENLAATVQSVKAILYTEQDLTEDQKEQARKNIGLDSEYGLIFDTFPSESAIKSMPNNSFFTVREYNESKKYSINATYYRTTAWSRNALKYTVDGTTIYIVPMNQTVHEIYLPNYGIKPGEEYAASNSVIISTLASSAQYGSTFRFPVGHFYFSEPIDVASKHISVIGEVNAGFRHINIGGTTFLHFPDLAEGEVALNVAQCTVSDITIYGNPSQYSMTLDRDEDSAAPQPVVNETCTVKAYGVKAVGSMIIRNVGVLHFYYAMWCETSNMSIHNVAFNKCHYGLSVGCDIKCFDVFGFDIMVLLQIRCSLVSATGIRGDSVGEHLVEIIGGGKHTLTDLDADFCMGAIVAIGNGINVSNIGDLIINGVHGRSGVSHVYPSGSSEITANDISDTNAGDFGVLAVKAGSNLNGAIIITNQGRSNPFDSVSGYNVPFVLLSADVNTVVKGVQIISTSCSGDEITTDWVRKRVASRSALPNACAVKVTTYLGDIKYTRDNNAVSVIDEAAELQKRMDLSAYVRDGEAIKTVNGIYPDDDGNVEIVEQEPEVVQTLDECKDTNKRYVLPDGYIYAYRKKFVPGGTVANFTNQLPISQSLNADGSIYNGVGYKYNAHIAVDADNKVVNEVSTTSTCYTTGLIPVKLGDVIRANCIGYHTGASSAYVGILKIIRKNFSASHVIHSNNLDTITAAGGSYSAAGRYGDAKISNLVVHVNNTLLGWVANAEIGYVSFTIWSTTPPKDVIITVNEEITYTVTEDHYEWNWESTGELYVKPDYMALIAELQNRVSALEKK